MKNLFLFIIGIVFLITGVIKSINSEEFILQNYRYNLFSSNIIPQIAIAFIGIESALGLGLILNIFPQVLIPSSIVLLIALSILTIWSTSTGKTEDCGCYGGIVIVTPLQSILLNIVYLTLLTIAWLNPIPNHQTQTWQWILTLIVMLITGIMAWKSQEKPLIDFSRLKIGNHWKRRWLKNSPHDLQKGSHFVVFLSRDCPYCKRWIPFLNMMNTQKDLPQVLGIMSAKNEDLDEFKEEQMVRFPLVTMDKLLFGYMVDAYPTAVSIEDGIITEKWIGEIPEEYLDRIKQIYEKAIFKSKTQISS
ncbi:MAG: hypothetical protein F6K23_28090 [Okeania sp. SIO2C9]|uniref:peroxiredoxin family protein n=1 Tax=Okeania sp. SIO2C9 TaxID=2607791 RepID=UPI0013C225F7|nr:MauE/DoxX family redox-associated membrane protein [Okeania sp. SIO2C9]NEQ76553.1 hypothetical protein [Okeania sp. SIO2C9]